MSTSKDFDFHALALELLASISQEQKDAMARPSSVVVATAWLLRSLGANCELAIIQVGSAAQSSGAVLLIMDGCEMDIHGNTKEEDIHLAARPITAHDQNGHQRIHFGILSRDIETRMTPTPLAEALWALSQMQAYMLQRNLGPTATLRPGVRL